MASPPIYRFDGITVDAAAMRVFRGSAELQLEPKSFRLLQFLIENRQRVLAKEELFGAIWPDVEVTDNALTRAVAQIRKVLEDDARAPRYIDTVPTVGYRFIGILDDAPASQAAAAVPGRRLRISLLAAALCVLLFSAAAFFWIHRKSPQSLQTAFSDPIPLTTYRGREDAPSFSPDGSQIAFEWDGEKQNNYDIYVKSIGSDSTPLRLTHDPAPEHWPAWSPDGRTIAFQRFVDGEHTELTLIPALGGPERKLGRFPLWADIHGLNPTWSPDSRWIIVSAATGSGASLFRVSVESGEVTPILPLQDSIGDVFPALSPDGRNLVFLRHVAFNCGELWMVPLNADISAAGPARRLTNVPAFHQARWLLNGTEILTSIPSGALRMAIDGSSQQTLPILGRYPQWIAVSPRGNRVAFTTVRGDANIWRIDLTQKTPHPQPLINSTVRDVYPQYSPDGRQIAFHTNRTGEVSQVWLADADGGNARQLTFMHSGVSGTAHWSRDGRTLTFDSNTSGIYQVYAISADGGKVTQLTHGDSSNFGSYWSRDGRWIYYASHRTGRNEVWKMTPDGKNAVQVTRNGGLQAQESPDGKTIYFCKEAGTGSIWRMPAGGGREEELVTSLVRSNFVVTSTGIYYMTAPNFDGNSDLRFYRLADRQDTLLMHMGVPEYGLDISPDGRFLVYDQLDDPASDLMLIENFH